MEALNPSFKQRTSRRSRRQSRPPTAWLRDSPGGVDTRVADRARRFQFTVPNTGKSFYERALGNLIEELRQTREKERQKIASYLHDEIGQNLILVAMKLGSLEMRASKRQAPIVREIRELISSVIHETRSLMSDLYPQALRELGLSAALEWLVERTGFNYDLRCVADVGTLPQVSEEIAEAIFYSVRELLINVAKHARAKQATLVCRSAERYLLIQVIDDGQGFETAGLSALQPACGGFGLLSIRERLSSIGASMHIESNPDHGTRVILMFPNALAKRAS